MSLSSQAVVSGFCGVSSRRTVPHGCRGGARKFVRRLELVLALIPSTTHCSMGTPGPYNKPRALYAGPLKSTRRTMMITIRLIAGPEICSIHFDCLSTVTPSQRPASNGRNQGTGRNIHTNGRDVLCVIHAGDAAEVSYKEARNSSEGMSMRSSIVILFGTARAKHGSLHTARAV